MFVVLSTLVHITFDGSTTLTSAIQRQKLAELTRLRGLEIGARVSQELLPPEKRFEAAPLVALEFLYPEVKLKLITGDKCLAIEVCVEMEVAESVDEEKELRTRA